MKHYLLFDAHCSVCSGLARDVQRIADDRLETLSLYSHQGLTLMKQAYPEGWERAPYLVAEDNGTVRAWTGFVAAVHLTRVFGLQMAWQVWTLVWQHRANVSRHALDLRQRAAATPTNSSRRHILKTVGVATAALAVWLGLRPARTAHADPWPPCCEGAYNQCSGMYYCQSNQCWAGSRDYMHKVDCYDVRAECMTLCSRTISIQCCNCC